MHLPVNWAQRLPAASRWGFVFSKSCASSGERRRGREVCQSGNDPRRCAWPRIDRWLSFLLDRLLGDNRDGTCEVALGEVDYLVGFHTEDDESSAEHSTSTSE